MACPRKDDPAEYIKSYLENALLLTLPDGSIDPWGVVDRRFVAGSE
jgi:hypothetical protein